MPVTHSEVLPIHCNSWSYNTGGSASLTRYITRLCIHQITMSFIQPLELTEVFNNNEIIPLLNHATTYSEH